MVHARTETSFDSVRAGDVIVHQSVAVGDVPGLLALCCRSALRAGLSKDSALRFASAIGQGLLDAFQHSERSPVLTLMRQGTALMTAQVATRGIGVPASEVGRWRELRTPRLVDTVTIHSNRRTTMLRLAVAIDGGAQPGQIRRRSPRNAGHFAQLAE